MWNFEASIVFAISISMIGNDENKRKVIHSHEEYNKYNISFCVLK